jgi:hypothetical protein
MTWPGGLTHRMGPSAEVLGEIPSAETLGDTMRLASRIAAALTLAVLVIGMLVSLSCAAEVRRWFAYPFAGIPARPVEAVAIFLHNLRALMAVGGLLLVAQSRYWARQSEDGPIHRFVQRAGEALLAAAVADNLVVVGASLGAYGTRMLRAMLPHGPAELGAYSLALALYFQGRGLPLRPRLVVTVLAMATAALAFAAVLETFG